MSSKGNIDEERGKHHARLSSCENVIGALHKCKWQDSCGSFCFILISPSLPDLSHIPQNIFKIRNNKKPWCMMASFKWSQLKGPTWHPPTPSLYQSWVCTWSPTDTPGIERPNKETVLLSNDVCVLLCCHCFPRSVKAYKAFLLHTLLTNCIKAFGDCCLSLRVCTSIKRGELRHVEARARHHLSSGEGCGNVGARRVWRWHLFVCTVPTNTGWQGTHKFSMARPPHSN